MVNIIVLIIIAPAVVAVALANALLDVFRDAA
jgi:hypothetical protein